MKVDGRHFRSIWLEPDGWSVGAIDQRRLPHEFVVVRMTNSVGAAEAIRSMLVRGAPLIGATAAFGVALAMRADASDAADFAAAPSSTRFTNFPPCGSINDIRAPVLSKRRRYITDFSSWDNRRMCDLDGYAGLRA